MFSGGPAARRRLAEAWPRLLRSARARCPRCGSSSASSPPAAAATPSIAAILSTCARRERELRRRDEVVARELLAGLAEVLEAEAPSTVLLLELLPLLVGELRKPAA